ncbi:caffeic acid 3-O-methyltransferase 1 [Morus notabilis]|uniref:caffeic acid 3-O-methyltransferase 1 n=1 Tax=Morus notabilis TaxID=981085 RepID=UPI000CED5181|nr:caffeic acid 3-O-methyltransferase 1 [Morus notabilis]
MCLVMSSGMPVCLKTAFELRVFDIIAKAGEGAKLSSAEIVAQMPTNNPDAATMLDRILRLLASHSVLSCSVVSDDNGCNVQRLYGLSPVSKYFVTNEDGVSLGHFIAMVQDKVFVDTWPQLKASILEGGNAFNITYGMHAFEYIGTDLRFNKVFSKAMHSHSTVVMKSILEHYKGFENIKQLVDVGGGLGVTLNQITSKYPHIKGINFDLPHVVENAPSYPGVEHVGGDMFQNVPCGDAIFMKWILHDWTDEHCLKLLKNCYKAISNDAKVIVVDSILPIMPETNFAVKSSLISNVLASDTSMLAAHPGGKERSQQEFLALTTGAGFSGIKFVGCVCNYWIMELYK